VEVHDNGDRFLVLEDGRRYDGKVGELDFRLMEFERYGIRLESRSTVLSDERSRIKPTMELLADPNPRNQAELLWRIGLPVSAVLVALLAIPLSAMNPRIGRSINLIAALLIYVLYNNLMSVTQACVAQQRIDFAIGVWFVHAVLVLLIVFLFWRRVRLP